MPFIIDRTDIIQGMGSKTVSAMFPSWDPTGNDRRLTMTKTGCTSDTEIGMETSFSAVAVDGKEYKSILKLIRELAGSTGSSPSFETIINGVASTLDAVSSMATPEKKDIIHRFGFLVKPCPAQEPAGASALPSGASERAISGVLEEAAAAVREAAAQAAELAKEAGEKSGAAQRKAVDEMMEAAGDVADKIQAAADALAAAKKPADPGRINLEVSFEMEGSWVITDDEAATDPDEYAKVMLLLYVDGKPGDFSGQHRRQTTDVVMIPITQGTGTPSRFIATVEARNVKLPVRVEPRIQLMVKTNGPGDSALEPFDWIEELLSESMSAIMVNNLRIRVKEVI